MTRFKRAICIVMDSVGAGQAPDAKAFDDEGSDTLGHIAEAMGGLNVPNLEKLGLGNIRPILGVKPQPVSHGYYGLMKEASASKDTLTGHWEMMGLRIDKPFKTFTETGFPQALIDELSQKTGHPIIGNIAASGTQIIKDLGERHMKTGEMIVYTSADSVLQIAAHEETFGLEELYRCCEIARELVNRDEWLLGRVIARPFIGQDAKSFVRTANRHDYALKPFEKTCLDLLKEGGKDVVSVGKILDIFDGEGITSATRTKSNEDGMNKTIQLAQEDFDGFMFVNLVDFDSLWGHRRDPKGYGQGIEAFDKQLGDLLKVLREDDILFITADHGNDPTFKGSDHTRELVPLLVYSQSFKESGGLALRDTFSDLGATVCDIFGVQMPHYGTSFLKLLK